MVGWRARVVVVVAVVAGWPVLLGTGCGPARFLSQVNDKAAGAVAAATSANAAERAPYEFTAATEYLRKAREAGAHAAYQDAIEYGRRAEELAIRARNLASQAGTTEAGAAADGGGQGGVAPGGRLPPREPPGGGEDSP